MANNVRLSSLAQKDLEKSAEWYKKQQQGLGEVFAKAIYDAAISISKNPAAYPIKQANTREFSVNKYPIIIVYKYSKKDDLLKVLHIFHTSRNPEFK